MSRIAAMTYRDIIRRLRAHGFAFERPAKGSHEIWYNPRTRLRTTVPCHPGTLPVGTTRAIIRATGLTPEEFLAAPASAAPPASPNASARQKRARE